MTKKSVSIDLIILDMILIFQDVIGWKIVKNMEQAQKGNSHLYAMKTIMAISAAFLLLCSCGSLMDRNTAPSREYHVSVSGDDNNDGEAISPFKTISAAMQVAQPGDVITVHEGVYRERVNPPRGGTSDDKRIVYRAAEGEKVVITGSEVVKNWQRVENGTWKISLPNSFFGNYNPYKEVIAGDWFIPQGRDHHTGEVYLNGRALFEEVSIDKVKKQKLSWCCRAGDTEIHILANFAGSNPNRELTEINVRAVCFYPDEPGRNYITVSGFIMRHAATQWAPPTAEQVALIGTHWSKGWIIENNVIHDSKCVGLTLGKYGDEFDNTSANSAEGYVKTIERALERGWSKDTIGSHLIRNNTIYNCGAAGICGSMGGAFSEVTGNHIYNINIDKPFSGHEMAGLKLHAPIDVLIKHNRIHHTSRGIWLDWMTQGTRVCANLLYNNGREDLFVEVNHGPYMVENNLFLTPNSLKDQSQGGSYSHNLFFGRIGSGSSGRETPYHKAHSTEVAGLNSISGGDNRFHNNILAGGGLDVYNESTLSMLVNGNVYLNGAKPFGGEENRIHQPKFNPNIRLIEEKDGVYLELRLPKAIDSQQNKLVTTELLSKTRVSGTAYENPDGSPITIDSDYFGKKRNKANPTAGPFESPGTGLLRMIVWQRNP